MRFEDDIRDSELTRLCDQYGWSMASLREFLPRLVDYHWIEINGGTLNLAPICIDAMEILEAGIAKELFLTGELAEIEQNYDVIASLNNKEFPKYSAEQLALHAHDFVAYQYFNKESLINTGFPETYFSQCRWLEDQIANLYFCKLPIAVTKLGGLSDGADCNGNILGMKKRPLVWSKNSELEVSLDGQTISMWGECRPEYYKQICSYQDAPIICEITQEQAKRLEELRPKVFDLKIDVLSKLVKGLNQSDQALLRKNVLGALDAHLTGDQIAFLVQIQDQLKPRTRPPFGTFLLHKRAGGYIGGISELIYVCAYFEFELRHGLWGKLKEISDATEEYCYEGQRNWFVVYEDPDVCSLVQEYVDKTWEQSSFAYNYSRSVDDFFNQKIRAGCVELADQNRSMQAFLSDLATKLQDMTLQRNRGKKKTGRKVDKIKRNKAKRIYEFRQANPLASWQEIGQIFEIRPDAARMALRRYEKKLKEKNSENS